MPSTTTLAPAATAVAGGYPHFGEARGRGTPSGSGSLVTAVVGIDILRIGVPGRLVGVETDG
jgi:hypothetical protein